LTSTAAARTAADKARFDSPPEIIQQKKTKLTKP
jgi:hypothetical protein